jgi:hypothetical protein
MSSLHDTVMKKGGLQMNEYCLNCGERFIIGDKVIPGFVIGSHFFDMTVSPAGFIHHYHFQEVSDE